MSMKRQRFDILVVGAGPAGLAAAVCAAQAGATVGLIDDNPLPGGQIWRGGVRRASSKEAHAWFDAAQRASTLTLLTHTRVIAPCADDTLLVETPREAIALQFGRLVICTGARELFLPFPGWTLPGVVGVGGLQALMKGGLPLHGKRIVIAGSGPLLLAVAAAVRNEGADVRLIAEQTSRTRLIRFMPDLLKSPGKVVQAARLQWELRGISFRTSCWVTQAHGADRLKAVTFRQGPQTWDELCDYLACGFGLVPNLELAIALGCAIRDGVVVIDRWQQTSRARVYAAGEVTGIGGVDLALLEGKIAGYAATDQYRLAQQSFGARARACHFGNALARTFALREELRVLAQADTIVCRCEDVPYQALAQHTSWRSAKLQSRCGMGACQGRVCGAATNFLFGWTQDSIRPPLVPARLASFADHESPLEARKEIDK